MNLSEKDPATAMPSAELDARLATEVMGWRWDYTRAVWDTLPRIVGGIYRPRTSSELETGEHHLRLDWSPSTNAAHAGELRRKANDWSLARGPGGVYALVRHEGAEGSSPVLFTETDGDKAAAEALAVCRAWLAALKARDKV